MTNSKLFYGHLVWGHSRPLLSSEGEHEHGTQRVERLREREGNIAASAEGDGEGPQTRRQEKNSGPLPYFHFSLHASGRDPANILHMFMQ